MEDICGQPNDMYSLSHYLPRCFTNLFIYPTYVVPPGIFLEKNTQKRPAVCRNIPKALNSTSCSTVRINRKSGACLGQKTPWPNTNGWRAILGPKMMDNLEKG